MAKCRITEVAFLFKGDEKYCFYPAFGQFGGTATCELDDNNFLMDRPRMGPECMQEIVRRTFTLDVEPKWRVDTTSLGCD